MELPTLWATSRKLSVRGINLCGRYNRRFMVIFADIASGGSIDWIAGEKDTGLVYCYELRDLGSNGFVLPASQIIPTGQETLDSIVVMLAEGHNLGYH